MQNFIITKGQQADIYTIGGKAYSLSTLTHLQNYIPNWFVVTPACFQDDFILDNNIINQIYENIDKLQGNYFAVRSSAIEEDGGLYSFAGQFESFLYIRKEHIIEKIIAVWKSAFTEQIIAYKKQQGLALSAGIPAILIQKMVNAEYAGVAFSANPTTGQRDSIVINAVHGLGIGVVSGEHSADTYIVTRDNIIENIVKKTHGFYLKEGQLAKVFIDKDTIPCLQQEHIDKVVYLTKACEKYFQKPQDIEWAIEKNQIYLLQSRPITTLDKQADPNATITLWDNSNIAENYHGVTTPLTFSFAKHVYTGVYREFCRLLGVKAKLLQDMEVTFQNMLGFLQGRIYYNLLNWYKLLAVLPGYKMNQGFMEKMMGVKEGLPEHISRQLAIKPANNIEKISDFFYFLNSLLQLLLKYFFLTASKQKFYQRLKTALQKPKIPLEEQRLDELGVSFRNLEQQLITRWDAPLLNDFFAMIFFGLLGKQLQKHFQQEAEALQANLLIATGDMISAQPAKQIQQLAQIAAQKPGFAEKLLENSQIIEDYPEFKKYYQAYLEKFSDRCLEELKLESPSLEEEPYRLLQTIAHLAQYQTKPMIDENKGLAMKKQAEATLNSKLHFLEKIWVNGLLDNVRKLLRDRENLRFERTLVFGRVRKIMLEIGKRLYANNILTTSRDIFYLELAEILGYIEGSMSCNTFKEIIIIRKQAFTDYQSLAPLPQRIQTYGSPYQGQQLKPEPQSSIKITSQDNIIQGIGCAAGIVEGEVLFVENPKQNIPAGKIVIAERTDPGWVMVFPLCKGLLIEHGSLLSHVAIVAREIGLPTITGLVGIKSCLKNGDNIIMDGEKGIVSLNKVK